MEYNKKKNYQVKVIIENYDPSAKMNYNSNWPYIPYYPYRILITGGSESGKTDVLLNLIKNQQQDIDKI